MGTDAFVADYTNISGNVSGVEIFASLPDDIACFHLKNHRLVKYLVVNFEDYPRYQKNKNCECMFVSINPDNKSWMLFTELKYCMEKNVKDNVKKAYEQVFGTLDAVFKEIGQPKDKYRIYVNVSVPDHSNQEPFCSFLYTQDELLDYKDNGIMVYGQNEIEVMNSGRLKTTF